MFDINNDIDREGAIALFEKVKVRDHAVRDLLDRCFRAIRNEATKGEIGVELDKEEYNLFEQPIKDRVIKELKDRNFITSEWDGTLKIYWLTEM